MCTCGPYWSIIPPEPCPIHDPARAYWRAAFLERFGDRRSFTTNATNRITYK